MGTIVGRITGVTNALSWVSTEINNHSWIGLYCFGICPSHSGQLSLATPLHVGRMSTGNSYTQA